VLHLGHRQTKPLDLTHALVGGPVIPREHRLSALFANHCILDTPPTNHDPASCCLKIGRLSFSPTVTRNILGRSTAGKKSCGMLENLGVRGFYGVSSTSDTFSDR